MDRLAAPGTPERPPPAHAPGATGTPLAEAARQARRGAALVGEIVGLLDTRSKAASASRLGEIADLLDAVAVRARVLAVETAFEACCGRVGFREVSAELQALGRRCGEALDRVCVLQRERAEAQARRSSSTWMSPRVRSAKPASQ